MTFFLNVLQSAKKRCYQSAFLASCAASLLSPSSLAAEEPTAKSPAAVILDSLCTARFEATHINKANAKETDIDANIGYQGWTLSLGSLDRDTQAGLVRSFVNVGLKASKLNWKNSPYFGESEQNNVFVEGAHNFDLDLPVALHAHGRLETDVQARQLCKYSMAFLSFWGSKEISGTNYSLGLYREIGRHSHLLLPMIGFQTAVSPNIQLDVLLPFHAKVLYKIDDYSLYAGVKSFKDRQRTQPADTAYSKSIWEYQTGAAHLGASYQYADIGQASLELGRTLSPSVRIYDAEGRHQATHRIGGSLFAQISLNVRF